MTTRIYNSYQGQPQANWTPTLKGPALDLFTLGCSSTQNNTLQDLQRTAVGPTPPKVSPDSYTGCSDKAVVLV